MMHTSTTPDSFERGMLGYGEGCWGMGVSRSWMCGWCVTGWKWVFCGGMREPLLSGGGDQSWDSLVIMFLRQQNSITDHRQTSHVHRSRHHFHRVNKKWQKALYCTYSQATRDRKGSHHVSSQDLARRTTSIAVVRQAKRASKPIS